MPATEPHVSAYADPAGETPWSMQLVVRIEKADPPTATAVFEAAAMAVVRLLDAGEDRAAWRAAIDRWQQGRIRKHCRRARGTKWDKVQHLPGVTVDHAGAQVRAFVPGPVDTVPPELAKLQLSGPMLDAPEHRPFGPVPAGTLVVSPPYHDWLSLGKAAAAFGHAAQVAWLQMPLDVRERWRAAGFPVTVQYPDGMEFAALVEQAPVVIRDAGFTEVEPGTVTAVARWE